MFSRLASLNRKRLRSLRVNFTEQRRCASAISRQSSTDLAIFKPSVDETHAAISIIVAEFKKADIGITKKGVQFLKTAYASGLSFEDIKNSFVLWGGLREEVLYGSTESPDDLYKTLRENSKSRNSAWRSQQTFHACIDSNVFKIWEALYSRSDLFKGIIEKDEKDDMATGKYTDRWSPHLQDYPLWEWLSYMLTTGIIEAGDVDNLPEPYKLEDIKAKATELQG